MSQTEVADLYAASYARLVGIVALAAGSRAGSPPTWASPPAP
jgi:hypothetical protein